MRRTLESATDVQTASPPQTAQHRSGSDDLVHLAMRLCQASAGGIAFVSEDICQYETSVGINLPAEVARAQSLCGPVLDAGGLLIADSSSGESSSIGSLLREKNLRFFAGINAAGSQEAIPVLFVADERPKPRGLSSEQVELLELVARQVPGILAHERLIRQQARHEEYHRFIRDLDRRVRELSDAAEIAQSATEALGNFLGATRAGFGEIAENARTVLFRSSYSDRSEALQGSYPLATFGLSAGATGPALDCIEFPTASSVSAIVTRQKRAKALLYAHFEDGRVWSGDEKHLLQEVAERIWEEIRRAQANTELQERESRLRAVLESVSDGFFALDSHWCFTVINRAAVRFFNRPSEQLMGVEIWKVIPDFEHTTAATRLIRVRAQNKPDTFEMTSAIRPGRTLEVRVAPNQREGLAVSFSDITERKAAEDLFRRREAHLAALYAQTAAGFAETDLSGRFLAVNARFCNIVGRSREDLLALTMTDITHPEDRDRSWELVHKMLQSGDPVMLQKRYLKPDGAVTWVANSVTLVRIPGAEPSTLAVTIQLDQPSG